MSTKTPPLVSFNDPTPEGAAFRGEQAMIDADIEGLARDERVERFMDELRAAGVPIEERMRRLGAFLRNLEQEPEFAAAE